MSKFLKKLIIFIPALIIFGMFNVANATTVWEGPTAAPPSNNRPEPINTSSVQQIKDGLLQLNDALILYNQNAGSSFVGMGLIIENRNALIFGDPLGYHVGLKEPAGLAATTVWSLPIADAASGNLLTTNGSGQLTWTDPATIQDLKWQYFGTGNDKIYSNKFVKIGTASSTPASANGAGDLYVQNTAEVNGTLFAQAVQAGSLKISGALRDSSNSAGVGGQLLSSTGTGVAWQTPAWQAGSGYIYSSQNTRIGSGNPARASGGSDLYVQGGLEVGGETWVNNLDVAGSLTLHQGLNLGFAQGSVIFQGPGGLAQNNSKFFWDDSNYSLNLGGNLKLPSTSLGGSEGILFLGNKEFLHNSGTYNISLGDNAGFIFNEDNIGESGQGNVAVGSYALYANSKGYFNTAIGAGSLGANDSGINNVALGYLALGSNTSSNNNVAIGANALASNGGYSNTAIGNNAGMSNETGNNNVILGSGAGSDNGFNGSSNIFIGRDAGSVMGANTNYKLFIEPSNANANNALIYGQFYNPAASSALPLLRFNGQVGIASRGSSFTVNNNALLHLYNNTNNAELDIQSTSTSSHWAMYQDKASRGLRFWNGDIIRGDKNLLSLSLLKNGSSGIGVGTTTPNASLHIYNNSGDNAELDIQSTAGVNNHWAIYNDATTNNLRFWNKNVIPSNLAADQNNILTLVAGGKVGIGITNPSEYVEIAKQDSSGSILGLSSFDSNCIGKTGKDSCHKADGALSINFIGGHNQCDSLGVCNNESQYVKKGLASIAVGWGTSASSDGFAYDNSKLTISTLKHGGVLSESMVARDGRVGISGDAGIFGGDGGDESGMNLYVHGSTLSQDYYGQQSGKNYHGNSAYACVGCPGAAGSCSMNLRFVDGLYICSCHNPDPLSCDCECGD